MSQMQVCFSNAPFHGTVPTSVGTAVCFILRAVMMWPLLKNQLLLNYHWILGIFFYNTIETLLVEPNEKREGNKEISVLDVGGKPKRIVPMKTQSESENPQSDPQTNHITLVAMGFYPDTNLWWTQWLLSDLRCRVVGSNPSRVVCIWIHPWIARV